MPNSFFQFKQFTVHQEHCAMKVCTDACLFGAWVAALIENNQRIKNILDIGTGTGLLSLLLAQKTAAEIDAIEINGEAALQASQNFDSSPWAARLKIFHTTIEAFLPDKKYGCIICNPPFFEDDLKSSSAAKNAAKHDTTLTLDELLLHKKRLLNEDGIAAILIPYHRTDYLENKIKENGFFINHKMLVRQSLTHGYFRSMLIFSKRNIEVMAEEIYIQDADRQYSKEFSFLLEDYYLKL